jgi:transposase
LVSKHPFDLKVISTVLGLNYSKFYRWYKEIFSEYKTEQEQQKLHEHDIGEKPTSDKKTFHIRVPILKPEHIGSHMAIDEKHINGVFYTVLTNGSTGKVALMIASMNPKEIGKCLLKFGDKLQYVSTLSRDLSPVYHSIADQYFPQATQVADKFHVIAHAIDSVQDIRIRLKQEELKNQRLEQAQHKLDYQQYIENKKEDSQQNIPKMSKTFYPKRLKNGETKAELLTRSKYLLYKMPQSWNPYQAYRAELLFEQFPQLQQAYHQINIFRKWYEPNNILDETWSFLTAETALLDWLDKTENSSISEIQNLRSTVQNHEQFIINYHLKYITNAIAESVNAKIKLATRSNKGTRDIDFFHFRLNLIL